MLTKEQIEQLPAGHEIDNLIARYVMGWKLPKDLYTEDYDPGNTHWLAQNKKGEWCWANYWDELPELVEEEYTQEKVVPFHEILGSSVWMPSQVISHTWEVVEKLSTKYHWRICSPFMLGDPWFAGCTPLSTTGWNGRPDYQADGPTAPLAICRAALLTVMTSSGR